MLLLTNGFNVFARPATRICDAFGGSAPALEEHDAVVARVNVLRNQPVIVVQTVVNVLPPAGQAAFEAQPETVKPKRTIGFAPPAELPAFKAA